MCFLMFSRWDGKDFLPSFLGREKNIQIFQGVGRCRPGRPGRPIHPYRPRGFPSSAAEVRMRVSFVNGRTWRGVPFGAVFLVTMVQGSAHAAVTPLVDGSRSTNGTLAWAVSNCFPNKLVPSACPSWLKDVYGDIPPTGTQAKSRTCFKRSVARQPSMTTYLGGM